ncbi:head-tail adaptor protein [Gellertiella hungarica]|uniref:SPP1 family predicted phage head-tail adaptor n=1 Tax=Gellertiella hungarica TaxID=1572859 RepID=A0A7W6J997_9HYPH|nr:head-tail adaptor protein [Gellertiella hungarica]MBB4067166.1 SPP1 family predicted phage head-tail adaptor [Gellertiella hungarica]
MRSGKLDRIIAIERSATTVAPTGDTLTAWTHFATVRAELLSSQIAEEAEGFGEADADGKTFRIRYLPGISGADRIMFEGRAYGVTGITEIGRRRALEIRAVVKK